MRSAANRHLPLLVWGALALAIAIAGVLISVWGEGQTILGDEWRYANWSASGSVLDTALDPPQGKYSLPVPLALYERAFEWFGIASYAPFRIAGIAALALVACLVFELLRRRVPYLAALAGAVLVLFLGSGAEMLVGSFRLPGQLSLAAGLAALVALERAGWRRDLIGCLLVAISVASHPQGLAFVAGAGALVLLRPGPGRWGSAWVFVLPGLLFALFLRPSTLRNETEPLAESLIDAPGFAFEGLVGATAALAGLVWPPHDRPADFTPPAAWALAGLVLAAVAAVVVLHLLRRRWPQPLLVAATISLLALLAAPTLAPGNRPPNLGRYLFPASVLLILVLAELWRQAPLRGRVAPLAAVAAVAVFGVSLASNALQLEHKIRGFSEDSEHVRAEAGALELARGKVDPRFKPEDEEIQAALGDRYRFPLSAEDYFRVAAAYGTPAYSRAELASRPAEVRRTAKVILARSMLRADGHPSERGEGRGGAGRGGPGRPVSLRRPDGRPGRRAPVHRLGDRGQPPLLR